MTLSEAPQAPQAKQSHLQTRIFKVTEVQSVYDTYTGYQSYDWNGFLAKLESFPSSSETMAEYDSASDDVKKRKKQVAMFCPGEFIKGGRTEQDLKTRSMTALDVDENVDASFLNNVATALDGIAHAIYETRNSRPSNRRYRIIIPFDADVSPSEYRKIVQYLSTKIGVKYLDDSMERPVQFTFFPSYSRDQDIGLNSFDGDFLNTAEALSEHATLEYEKLKQEASLAEITDRPRKKSDPEQAPGIVGAFNRAISLEEALEHYIPEGTYIEQPGGRLMYHESESGAAGAEIVELEHGRFFASSHASDPARGLWGAFDLVRIHLFGELDVGTRAKKPSTQPSYIAMVDFLATDEFFKRKSAAEIAGVEASEDNEEDEWLTQLKLKKDGETFESSAHNIFKIADNDKRICDVFSLNEFTQEIRMVKSTEWRKLAEQDEKNLRIIEDMQARGEHPTIIQRVIEGQERSDDSSSHEDTDKMGLRRFYSSNYGIELHSTEAGELIRYIARKQSHHPIRDYLEGVRGTWDGTPRVEQMFTRYLGAEDNALNHEIAKMFLKGAIARIQAPGVTFPYVLILHGDHGDEGKSSFFKTLAGGDKYFNDSIKDLKSKDAAQSLIGNWIVELAELTAISSSKSDYAKQFATTTSDKIRLPYAANVTAHPRQSVIGGTTNPKEFLTDVAGNRRYLIVSAGVAETVEELKARENWNLLIEERDQLWAEALEIYSKEPDLNLTQEFKDLAAERALEYTTFGGADVSVDIWLDADIPVNRDAWYKMTVENRHGFTLANNASRATLRNRQFNKEGLTTEAMKDGYIKRTEFCLKEAVEEIVGMQYSESNAHPGLFNRVEAAIKAHPRVRPAPPRPGKKYRPKVNFGKFKAQYAYEIMHDTPPERVEQARQWV